MRESVFVGIDVSKSTLDYTWLPDGKPLQTTNSQTGIEALIKVVSQLQSEMVVLEATGGYQTALVGQLHKAGLPVHVANPRQVRDFARSLNRLGKTDTLDALTLAEFAQSRKLEAQRPKSKALSELSNLPRRRDQLQQMLTIERNHLEQISEALRPQVVEHIAILKSLSGEMDRQIKALIGRHSPLKTMDEIIQSVPGLGPITAATLIAELPEITLLGRKQVAALVGLAPYNRDSGRYRGQRHIFAGRARVRKVLYCALRPCLQYNQVARGWFDRSRDLGKPYKVAAIACCRKILNVIRAMLISNSSWQSESHHNT